MDSIREKQESIIRDFSLLDDPFDQYAYLLELAALLPRMDDDRRAALGPVKGCQSNVWLDMRAEGEIFLLNTDSDTMLIRGILYLLQKVLFGEPLRDVAEAKLDFLERCRITPALSVDRRKGIGYVIQEVQYSARAMERKDTRA